MSEAQLKSCRSCRSVICKAYFQIIYFNMSHVYTMYIHIYITNYINTIVLHTFVDLHIYLQNMYVLCYFYLDVTSHSEGLWKDAASHWRRGRSGAGGKMAKGSSFSSMLVSWLYDGYG